MDQNMGSVSIFGTGGSATAAEDFESAVFLEACPCFLAWNWRQLVSFSRSLRKEWKNAASSGISPRSSLCHVPWGKVREMAKLTYPVGMEWDFSKSAMALNGDATCPVRDPSERKDRDTESFREYFANFNQFEIDMETEIAHNDTPNIKQKHSRRLWVYHDSSLVTAVFHIVLLAPAMPKQTNPRSLM